MTLASFVFCVGVNATASLTAFVHWLFVLLTPHADCGTPNATDPWVAAAVTGAVLLPLLLLMSATRAFLRQFRWPLAVNALMGLFALLTLWPYLQAVTLGGVELCAAHRGVTGETASLLERAWVPCEVLLVALCAWRARQGFSDRAAAEGSR